MGGFRVGGGLVQTQVDVTTGGELVVEARTLRKSVTVLNYGDAIVYLGGVDVTPLDGMPMASGVSVSFDDYNGPVYAITASGTGDVRVLEVA